MMKGEKVRKCIRQSHSGDNHVTKTITTLLGCHCFKKEDRTTIKKWQTQHSQSDRVEGPNLSRYLKQEKLKIGLQNGFLHRIKTIWLRFTVDLWSNASTV